MTEDEEASVRLLIKRARQAISACCIEEDGEDEVDLIALAAHRYEAFMCFERLAQEIEKRLREKEEKE